MEPAITTPTSGTKEISQELFLSNLDPLMTEAELRSYFDKFGRVDEFVKKERYGFLHFESGAAMKAMLAAGEHHTVGNFPPFIVRVSKAVAKNDNKYIPNQVFLHNLPRAANAANLKERFEQYGEIKDCRIMYHSVSGLPRTAKITFVNAAEFNNVIKKEQISFLGSIVDVRRSLVSTTGGGSGKGSGREYGDKRRKH